MSGFILYINIILLQFIFTDLSKIKNLLGFSININEIKLVIQGRGNQNILNDQFKYEPSLVYINGIQNNSCSKTYYLSEEKNNITINFSREIKSFENMFKDLKNIIEVDISNSNYKYGKDV